ncbi:hypothetical protein LNP25_25970 [Klebsiella variicola subsp. variicola]|nr:hypothetical protein [Klebsiella variicola subsp. variicola]
MGNFPLPPGRAASRRSPRHRPPAPHRRPPHQTDFAAAIDKRQPLLRQRTSDQTGGVEIQRMFAS